MTMSLTKPTAESLQAAGSGSAPRPAGAWSLVRQGELRALWRAARRRLTDPDAATIDRWYREGCEETLRLDYPLTPESVVFDVGGYRGDFAANMAARYHARVYVFEPVPQFFDFLRQRFAGNPKIRVLNYGLAETDAHGFMVLSDSGSSLYRPGEATAPVHLRDIARAVQDLEVPRIDLMKVNIEAGEYTLLPRMIEKGIHVLCHDLQIQFHRFYPNAARLREEIRDRLRPTHFLTYEYPFIWENWRKKLPPLDELDPANPAMLRSRH